MTTQQSLGDRMRAYESRETSRRAMPGLPLVVRVDGRGFSKFTQGMTRPFDLDFAELMRQVAAYLVEQTQARVGYVQSDEITLILDPEVPEDTAAIRGEVLFDGRFQKLTSVIAGLATARFVSSALTLWPDRCARQLPVFDARVFEVPSREEAAWVLAWREADATKNAISMACRAYHTHRETMGQTSAQKQEMLFAKGVNFNDYPAHLKRGTYVQRRKVWRTLDAATLSRIPPDRRPAGPVERRETVFLDLPPLRRMANWMVVLWDGAEPVLRSEASPA